MIPNVTRGADLPGLLGYLFGPGRRDEHVDQRVVAGYDPAELGTARGVDGTWDQVALAAMMTTGWHRLTSRPSQPVWHCSLSVPSDERPLDDAEWAEIATDFAERMGFGDAQDRSRCRWIAVHHGRSAGGNDHIHFVTMLATEVGKRHRFAQRSDYRMAQRACAAIEIGHGLLQRTPARDAAGDRTKRPVTTQRERLSAERRDRAPDREWLRIHVRAAAAGAENETDWIDRMKKAGLSLRPRTGPGGVVTGYAVARPGNQTWWGGGKLDGDLTLPRIRARWPGQLPASPSSWTTRLKPARLGDGDTANVAWRAAAEQLVDVALVDEPDATTALGDLACLLAQRLDYEGRSPVTVAAHQITRATAPPRQASPCPRSASTDALRAIARTLAAVNRPADDDSVEAVLLAVVRLVEQLAILAEANRRAHTAGTARSAQTGLQIQRPDPAERAVDSIRLAAAAYLTTTAEQPRAATPARPEHRVDHRQERHSEWGRGR